MGTEELDTTLNELDGYCRRRPERIFHSELPHCNMITYDLSKLQGPSPLAQAPLSFILPALAPAPPPAPPHVMPRFQRRPSS